MRQFLPTLAFVVLFLGSQRVSAQVLLPSDSMEEDHYLEDSRFTGPCISAEQYAAMEKRLQDNCRLLGLDEKSTHAMNTKFFWPLRPANGLDDCSYFTIRNYVDQDPTADSIRDWNCGKRTYDGHRGVDITPYPYQFYKMDHDQVEVVAAAPGTIVDKVDGHYDRNCVWVSGTPANYLVIRHADGSRARYVHMKKNSLTAKNIGQTVATGEYLGIVGSSGYSTGPHLHFEVWKTQSSSQYLDPFGGSCNPLNDSSLWVAQPLYLDPGILKVSVNPISPVFPECPVQETPNEDSCFLGGGSAKFYVFLRDQREATTVTLRIRRPDGSVVSNWTRTFPSSASRSYWSWTRTLPSETGSYVFEAAYDGEICAKPFKINCNLTHLPKPEHRVRPLVFPNPVYERTALRFDPALTDREIGLYNAWGHRVLHRLHFTGSSLPIHDANLPAGLYRIEISDGVSGSTPIKLVISE